VTQIDVLRPFVERTIAEYLGIDEDLLKKDEDGMIPIRAGSAVVNVRLAEGGEGHPILEVFAPLLRGIPKTPALMERLNDVNAGLTFARAFWVDDRVILTIELRAESLDADQVAQAVSVVSLAANHWDTAIKQEFGGETSFPDENGDSPDPPAPNDAPKEVGGSTTGGYL
jgi:T3SS (YopN, CesT) and YbjN peptide-binding chaperone 1